MLMQSISRGKSQEKKIFDILSKPNAFLKNKKAFQIEGQTDQIFPFTLQTGLAAHCTPKSSCFRYIFPLLSQTDKMKQKDHEISKGRLVAGQALSVSWYQCSVSIINQVVPLRPEANHSGTTPRLAMRIKPTQRTELMKDQSLLL